MYQFLSRCHETKFNPEDLLDVFKEAEVHSRIKYCLLRYMFSDYRVLSELNRDEAFYQNIARTLKRNILMTDTVSLESGNKNILERQDYPPTRSKHLN